MIATIFVNPTQFGPQEDLERYPRDLPRDLQLLENEGVDLVWLPTSDLMYPKDFQTWVTVEKLTEPLEGSMRPGHFRGVTTVVAKLFNATQPQKAYFGQKDAQQAAVIRRMTMDLNYPIEVIVCPIVREADGLALSSRNVYLDQEQRAAATCLYRSLLTAQSDYQAGERNPDRLRQTITEIIHAEPQAKLQYVSCSDAESLYELESEITGKVLISMAVFFGKTRLIDNILLGD